MTIEINTGSYGFGRTWTLCAYGKKFYLGQDSKFCHRVLGMDANYIASQIGSKDLSLKKTRANLARFICQELGVTRKSVNSIDQWGLCAE
jgi:hypothetical protein